MSQIVMDPKTHVQAPTRDRTSPMYGAPSDLMPTAQPNKRNGLSIAALVCAVVGFGLSIIPLVVSGVSRGIALGVVSAGLGFGVLATVLGAMGRGRAVSTVLGMAALVLGILSLVWTIGGFACTMW